MENYSEEHARELNGNWVGGHGWHMMTVVYRTYGE